jgi:Arc/MetJ-type ribon-helix-helix transcriptional regulator
VPEIRVTVGEKLNLFLDEIVASGIYSSKAELMRSGLVHLLKDLGLLPNFKYNNNNANNK